MSSLVISLLGGFSVTLDNVLITNFASNKTRALLAYLAVESNRAHSRDNLAAMFWPEMPNREAHNNLRSALSNLRLSLGDLHSSQSFFIITRQTIKLDLNMDIEVDALILDQCLTSSQYDLTNLEKAVDLYRGDFLEGFSIPDCSEFEEWIWLKRERYQQKVITILRQLVQDYEKVGNITQALPFAWRQVEFEPWFEEPHRCLMYLLALSGQRSAALAQYEVCKRALSVELNVDPSIETTHLYEQILNGEIIHSDPATEKEIQPIKKISGDGSERSAIAPERMNRSGIFIPRWAEIAGVGLVGLGLILAAFIVVNKSIVIKPEIAIVAGKLIVPCANKALTQLCVADAQTGQVSATTASLPIDRLGPGASWSPDGKQIVFSATTKPKQGAIEDFDLYLINVDGTNLRQITSGTTNDVMPAWSPDGTLVAFHRNCNLWIMNPDGSQEKQLSNGLCATGLSWSPDSQWIAFIDTGPELDSQRRVTIRVFQREGNESSVLYTFDQPVNGGRVAWSPDGQQIFCIYDVGNGRQETMLIDAQGQGLIKAGLDIPENWFQDFFPQWGER